jgi:hypothetical protein
MNHVRTAAVSLCAIFIAFDAQAASYFVQPVVTVSPGAFINGLEVDGATFRAEGYNNAPTAVNTEVDLEAGTIRGTAIVGGGGLPSGASQGRFGEQLTFHNADNTMVNLAFSFDGSVQAPARDPNLNSRFQLSVDAYIAIFDPAVGATASSWYDLSFGNLGDHTLFKDRRTYDFSDPTEDLDEYIQDSLDAWLDVTPTQRSFDIFANLTLIANPNSNPGPVALDFLNTATFSIGTEPGASYTSLSGVFLDSTGVTAVPGPATLPLLLSGLASLAGLLRMRRRT